MRTKMADVIDAYIQKVKRRVPASASGSHLASAFRRQTGHSSARFRRLSL